MEKKESETRDYTHILPYPPEDYSTEQLLELLRINQEMVLEAERRLENAKTKTQKNYWNWLLLRQKEEAKFMEYIVLDREEEEREKRV